MRKVRITIAGRDPFKHRELLEFRGVSYRYDKPFGEWRLVDPKNADYFVPKTIYGYGDRWEVHSTRAATPLLALETWFAELIDLRKREAAEAKQKAAEAAAEAKRLKTASWKAGKATFKRL